MIDFNYTAPELLPFRIQEVLDAPNEPHRIGGVVYVPEGGGECEWTLKDEWLNRTGDDHVFGYETSCGARHTWWPDSLPNFCPTCGGKVKAVMRNASRDDKKRSHG